jgi:hypothetical protein
MRFFKTDLKRAFTEPAFFTAVLLGLSTLVGAFFYLKIQQNNAGFIDAQALVFPFAAPFLSALPYAFMSKAERDINYMDLLKLRRGGRGYTLWRFLTVGISGGVALLVPELVLAIVAAIYSFTSGNLDDAEQVFYVLALAFPFGFAFSVLAFALTYFNRLTLLAVITPEILYLLLTYAFPYLDLEKYYPPLAVSPYIYGSPDIRYIGGLIVGVLLIAVVLTFLGRTFQKR